MTRTRFTVAAAMLALAWPAYSQIAMPDPTQIAGRAIPGPELADGTVSVRLVREQLGNNIVGHEVTVTAGDVTRTAKTDESGRAQVSGLSAGATAVAETTVDGERLTSQSFQVPASGGIRVILIAGLDELAARRAREAEEALSAPASPGAVVFGGDSRVILEFQDDALQVFYLLDIVNNARTRVDTGGPLILDLPRGAAGATILQGSAPGATARGDRVTITGPFNPGTTPVQIGFRLQVSSSTETLVQKFPAALERVTVILEQVGEAEMSSPQFAGQREVRAENGTPFMMGTGNGLPAGGELSVQLSGLPLHSVWPRNVALALALAVLALGAWLAFGAGEAEHERRRLRARRDSLYGELVKLEAQHRAGRVDAARYHARRQDIVGELERIYGELDAGGPDDRRGGDEAAA